MADIGRSEKALDAYDNELRTLRSICLFFVSSLPLNQDVFQVIFCSSPALKSQTK